MHKTPGLSGHKAPHPSFYSYLRPQPSLARYGSVLVMLILCSLLLGACGPNPTDQSQPSPTASSSLKVQSALLNIFLTYQTAEGTDAQKRQAALQYARNIQAVNDKDEAVFDVVLDQPERQQAVIDKVKSMGGTVRQPTNIEGTVKMRVVVPVDTFINYSNSTTKDNFLADLASFQGVKTIDLIVGGQPQELTSLPPTLEALLAVAQASKNEGIKVMGADKWHAAGFRGKGAKVGIIDAGFKFHQQLRGSVLPADFEVKDIDLEQGGPGTAEDDVHGTAVAEIIYSLAPEAQIIAASVDGSDIEYKAAFDYMASQGVNIISMSLGSHTNAGDGSSVIERYIERLRQEKNMLFLIAAGNSAAAHYSAFFNPDEQGFHQFLPGVTRVGVANFNQVPLRTYLSLVWEQWGQDKAQVNDLDLFLVDRNGKPVAAGSSQDRQSVRDPIELIPIRALPSRELFFVQVRQKPGTPAYSKPFRLHLFGRNFPLQFRVPQMSVAYPSSSKGSLAVGAIQWDEDKWAYYSSQGPLPNGIFKPEISAPAGVSSRSYEEAGGDVFDGTSAATPESAGVAAILKGANPNLNVEQLENLLKEAVTDLTPGGPDYASGYGRLNIGELRPAAGIAPQGKVRPVQTPANLASLQFPVLVFQGYPTPQAGAATAPKAGVPTPLPSRGVRVENGATDDSRISGGSNPPPAASPAPTSTPTRPATTAATTPEPVSNITFRDSFRDNTSGLPNQGNTLYQNGSYRVKAASSQLSWGVYPASLISLSDFSAEVNAQGIAGREGVYGLVFWHKDANNYFLLSVSGSGQYQVSQYNGGSYREIVPWTPTQGWRAGQSNTLRIAANRGNLTITINNRTPKVVQASGQGAVGFAAGSYGNPVEAAYSNFVLTTGR